MTKLDTINNAVPTMAGRQRPMMAVTINAMATNAAIPARIAREGIVAFASVKPAPKGRKPELGETSDEYC